MEKYLGNGNNIRDDKWTKGIAVGSKGFVEHVKSALGALAKGRKAKGSGDSYQLREPSAPYQADSLARPRFQKKERTTKEVNMLKKELSRFESTYQMSSEDFFDRFEKRELGDKEDYFEWSAMYQMYERSVDRLNILEAPSI